METTSLLVLSSLDPPFWVPFVFGALLDDRDWSVLDASMYTKSLFMCHEYLETYLYSRLDLGCLNVTHF